MIFPCLPNLSKPHRYHLGDPRKKRAGALRLPARASLGNLSVAAAADQQLVVVEALTTAGLAVLVYVNWHCAGVVAAVT